MFAQNGATVFAASFLRSSDPNERLRSASSSSSVVHGFRRLSATERRRSLLPVSGKNHLVTPRHVCTVPTSFLQSPEDITSTAFLLTYPSVALFQCFLSMHLGLYSWWNVPRSVDGRSLTTSSAQKDAVSAWRVYSFVSCWDAICTHVGVVFQVVVFYAPSHNAHGFSQLLRSNVTDISWTYFDRLCLAIPHCLEWVNRWNGVKSSEFKYPSI